MDIAKLKAELEAAQKEVGTLTKQVSELEAAAENHGETIKALETERDTATANAESAEVKANEAAEKVTALESELETVKADSEKAATAASEKITALEESQKGFDEKVEAKAKMDLVELAASAGVPLDTTSEADEDEGKNSKADGKTGFEKLMACTKVK